MDSIWTFVSQFVALILIVVLIVLPRLRRVKFHAKISCVCTIYIMIYYVYFLILFLCLFTLTYDISLTNLSTKYSLQYYSVFFRTFSPYNLFSNTSSLFLVISICNLLYRFIVYVSCARTPCYKGSRYYWYMSFPLISQSVTHTFPLLIMYDIRFII